MAVCFIHHAQFWNVGLLGMWVHGTSIRKGYKLHPNLHKLDEMDCGTLNMHSLVIFSRMHCALGGLNIKRYLTF